MYKAWLEFRESKLKEELHNLDHFDRKENITSLLHEMEEREKRLFFFENEEEIDLRIEEKQGIGLQQKSAGQIQKDKVYLETGYIPPEVDASRNK